jgi:hypothetical protein
LPVYLPIRVTRNRVAATVEIAFAIAVTLCAIARPTLWRAANSARVFVLLEAAAAVYLARGLMNGRAKVWLGAFILSAVGVVELWYLSAAFVFSYMGEGMPDHAGLLLLMGCFSLQGIVLVLYVIERLALWRRAIRSYESDDSAR